MATNLSTPEARDALRQLRARVWQWCIDLEDQGSIEFMRQDVVPVLDTLIGEALDGGLPAQPDVDLLAACKSLVEFQRVYEINTWDVLPGNKFYSEWLMAVVNQARVAIAKVEAPPALPAQRERETKDDDDQSRGGKWGSAQADLPRRNDGDM